MLRPVATILVLLAMLMQGAGHACRPVNPFFLVPPSHADACAEHAHAHDSPDADHAACSDHAALVELLNPFHDHGPSTPAHVHVCRCDSTAPQHRATLALPKPVEAPVAIMVAWDSLRRLIDCSTLAAGAPQRRCLGPPASIRTTRLLI